MKLTTENFQNIILKISDVIKKNEEYLNQLDQAIGDGDHGVNMNRGFAKLATLLPNYELKTLSEVFNLVAKVLISTVGGASGPLYGMAFMKAAKVIQDVKAFGLIEFQKFIKTATEAIVTLGKAQLGDKTMVDVWIPFNEKVQSLAILNEENKLVLLNTLDQLVIATKPMKAIKGRAAFLGERSINHIDPGSVSTGLILKEIVRCF